MKTPVHYQLDPTVLSRTDFLAPENFPSSAAESSPLIASPTNGEHDPFFDVPSPVSTTEGGMSIPDK